MNSDEFILKWIDNKIEELKIKQNDTYRAVGYYKLLGAIEILEDMKIDIEYDELKS